MNGRDLRNQRTFAAAQSRRDASEPASFHEDDDMPTIEDAEYQACSELMRTPAVVADILAEICDPSFGALNPVMPGRDPIDVATLCDPGFDAWGRPAYELLAVAMVGDGPNAFKALRELRDRVRESSAMHALVRNRADELMEE